MADVFFSYAHEDRPIVQELARLLSRRGYSCWWDREIGVGATFTSAIDEALSSAKSVVVLWSQHSINSHWVHGEAGDALERNILVPAIISDVKIPIPFRSAETAQLIDWPSVENQLQLQKLISAIDSLMEESNSPASAADDVDAVDPTLSVRVADRVAQAMVGNASSENAIALRSNLALETSISNCAIACISNQEASKAIDKLFRDIAHHWDATHLSVWKDQELLFEKGKLPSPDFLELSETLISRNDHLISSDDSTLLKAYALSWLYRNVQDSIYFCIGSTRGNVPSNIKRARLIIELMNYARVT